MKVFTTLLILTQHIHKKIRKDIVISRHRICHIKKLRKNHKIDCNVFLSRRKDLMSCILIQEKKFPLPYHDFPAADDIGQLSLTDIKHLDKIMPVCRKMNKTSVRTHGDQFTFVQHLRTVYNEILTGCIKVFIHLRHTIQYLLFFFCYDSQMIQKSLLHVSSRYRYVTAGLILTRTGGIKQYKRNKTRRSLTAPPCF